MKVKALIGTLIFLIVLNIAVLGSIIYVHLSDTRPPLARLMDRKPDIELPVERDRLTSQQRQKLRQQLLALRQEVMPIRHEVRELERELVVIIIEQDSLDQAKARQIMHDISQKRLKMGEMVLQSLQESKLFLDRQQQRLLLHMIMKANRHSGDGPPLLQRRFDPGTASDSLPLYPSSDHENRRK